MIIVTYKYNTRRRRSPPASFGPGRSRPGRRRPLSLYIYIYTYTYIHTYIYIYIHYTVYYMYILYIYIYIYSIVCMLCYIILHPVSITRFPRRRLSPGAGLPRNPLFRRKWLRLSRGWVRKDGNLLTETGCSIMCTCSTCCCL